MTNEQIIQTAAHFDLCGEVIHIVYALEENGASHIALTKLSEQDIWLTTQQNKIKNHCGLFPQ